MLNTEIKIAIVVSLFNQEITDKLLEGAVSSLIHAGITKEQMTIRKVPGAIEIPLTAKMLALSKQYHAIICLGAVIRGETDHYEYVCQQVSQGCQQVMLEYNLPIIFGVLTTQNKAQAQERACGNKGNKGAEAAQAAMSMINLMQSLQKFRNMS